MTSATQGETGIVGVGYEGLNVERFVAELGALGVGVLVDVRLTPISRKPGFSKRALAAAVAGVGVDYVHLPALGNPKSNRTGFAGSPEDLLLAQESYRAVLASLGAREAIDYLVRRAQSERVAVLCFEADTTQRSWSVNRSSWLT